MLLSQAIAGFSIYTAASSYSDRTREIHAWALGLWLRQAGDVELAAVTLADLRAFIAWATRDYVPTRAGHTPDTSPLAPASVQNIWITLRSFWRWADDELHVGRPDNGLARPKFRAAEIQPFGQDDIVALLKAAEYTRPAQTTRRTPFAMRRPTGQRDVALILVMLDTGLRAGELCRLRVKDVDLETGETFVQAFGTGAKTKSRTVYLGKAARRAVWRYLAQRGEPAADDPLFLARERPMTRFTVKNLAYALGDAAGVPDCHPHRFRHTFAIQYLRNGGDVFTLQRLLGHSSLEMVRRYLTLADADAATAHQRASPADRWRL